MKLYLDDERETPAECVRVFWPDEAIAWLKTGAVTEISLDHDLGDDNRGTGYDVILWIEKEVMTNYFIHPKFVFTQRMSPHEEKWNLVLWLLMIFWLSHHGTPQMIQIVFADSVT
ncbi:cyclic-phosphate processing receiver domain-containing protein [Aeromonas veronii]